MPVQEPSVFLILNGGLTATPTMSFRLGIAAFSSGVGRFSSDWPAPFSGRAREHRSEKQIAGRRVLFMETNDRDLFCGERSVDSVVLDSLDRRRSLSKYNNSPERRTALKARPLAELRTQHPGTGDSLRTRTRGLRDLISRIGAHLACIDHKSSAAVATITLNSIRICA